MLNAAMLVLLVVAMLTVSGCASSSPSASVATAPVDVNGTWMGSAPTGARNVSLLLQQNGMYVAGALAGAGVIDGPIHGIVEGNMIKITSTPDFGATPRLSVTGDTMTGDLAGARLNLRRVQ